MESMVNKSVLGDLTLGEVWDSVKDRVDEVRVEEEDGETIFTTFHTTPGVSLGFSNHSADDEDSKPDYSFDLDAKVKVREDHVELSHENWFGDEKDVQIYFLIHPEPQTIRLDFLLPGETK